MKNVSVILARGGSKGIPNKNLVMLCGHPLIYYTIAASILSKVDETWISTDSEEIAKVACEWGAKVLMRPQEFATDISSSEDALVHFAKNTVCDNIVMIQPTSPLLTYEYIDQGLDLLKYNDAIFSGCKEHWVPRWEEVKSDDGVEYREYSWHKTNRPRRQDKESLVIENGALYISSRGSILKNKLRYSGKIGCVEMPVSMSFQVDNYDDLFIIESILTNKNGGKNV